MAKKKIIKDATIASEEEIKEVEVEETEEVEEELEDIEEEFDDLEEDDDSYEDYDAYDDEKESKSKKKKEVEEKEKKTTKKKENKGGYFAQVSKEMKKVVWPKGSEIVKNTVTVIVFIVVLCLFFYAVEFLAAFIKGLFA